MKIATLLFTYNRSLHTKQVIEALSQNYKLPEKLFVFQDGLKSDSHKNEWHEVNKLINHIDWCDTELYVSKVNRGLAASIVEGITYVLREYDAVIVLEDDCVPAVGFIDFMQQCFEKYQNNKRVYSVSGYAYPVDLKKEEFDIYACGRISSWGWGTWKDRWSEFKKDYELVKKMKEKDNTSKNLAMWGRGLEDMLVGNIRGECDSWAVFWALNVISKEGICVNPYKSLIKNIGLDGTGVHCSVTNRFDVELAVMGGKIYRLPDKIEIKNKTVEAFTPLFGSYTAINENDGKRQKILVYGLGNFYFLNEQDICEKYEIEAFIDQRKSGWFAGKRIIKRGEIEYYMYDRILIMIQNVMECMKVVKELEIQGIRTEKILIGHDLY